MAKTIGILLFDDVEELDAVGPWEVLAAWCSFWPDDGWRVTTFSVDGETVTGAKGLKIVPHHSAADVGDLAVVLHPGGPGHPAAAEGPGPPRPGPGLGRGGRDHHQRLHRLARSTPPPGCWPGAPPPPTGPRSTPWPSWTRTIEVRPDDRYVDDGDVVTSAGVSAGIDMALALVGRLVSPERAQGRPEVHPVRPGTAVLRGLPRGARHHVGGGIGDPGTDAHVVPGTSWASIPPGRRTSPG